MTLQNHFDYAQHKLHNTSQTTYLALSAVTLTPARLHHTIALGGSTVHTKVALSHSDSPIGAVTSTTLEITSKKEPILNGYDTRSQPSPIQPHTNGGYRRRTIKLNFIKIEIRVPVPSSSVFRVIQ